MNSIAPHEGTVCKARALTYKLPLDLAQRLDRIRKQGYQVDLQPRRCVISNPGREESKHVRVREDSSSYSSVSQLDTFAWCVERAVTRFEQMEQEPWGVHRPFTATGTASDAARAICRAFSEEDPTQNS